MTCRHVLLLRFERLQVYIQICSPLHYLAKETQRPFANIGFPPTPRWPALEWDKLCCLIRGRASTFISPLGSLWLSGSTATRSESGELTPHTNSQPICRQGGMEVGRFRCHWNMPCAVIALPSTVKYIFCFAPSCSYRCHKTMKLRNVRID
jgi:hypothetical protein